MADLEKHRQEKENYPWDFQDSGGTNIGSSETLSNPTVAVAERGSDGTWSDVSSEFGSPSGSIQNDTEVHWTLTAASSGDQSARTYMMLLEVDTDEDRHLVETPTLSVTDEADI